MADSQGFPFFDPTKVKDAIVTGDDADTDIAVTGITTDDYLLFVTEFAATSNDPTSRTATTSITSNGNIQCSDATNNDSLLVVWYDSDG